VDFPFLFPQLPGYGFGLRYGVGLGLAVLRGREEGGCYSGGWSNSTEEGLTVTIGAAAAQVVPHVHFHIIPRPALTPELRNRSFTMFGRGQRSELDEDEAEVLVAKLRAELEVELAKEKGEKGKL
jgi:HIT domain